MIKSYLSIVLRYMIRHKGFSFINIVGLTIGISCSLLILLYVRSELSFDRFHPDAGRIYRVALKGRMQGKKIESAYTGSPLAPKLRESPMVEETFRMASWATFPVHYENRSYTEPNLLLADANFFRFFHFPLVEGHPDSVLDDPREIVITESAARRYFDYTGKGDRRPIGKTIVLAQGYTATISGIAEDPPANAHFHFTFVLSLASWDEALADGWTSRRVITYFKLKPEADPGDAAALLQEITNRYVNPELEQLRNVDITRFKDQGNDLSFFIQPLRKIHLHSHLMDEVEPNGDINSIYLFSAIAAFITLIACINFMNLTTARSASRAKEVGVRKSVGAPNARLVTQFLLESYFYIIIAVLLALLVVIVALAPFNVLSGKQLTVADLFNPVFLGGLVLFVAVTGLLAGSYPAFYLTMFNPVEVLKGRVRTRLRSYGIRNALVVFQFFISAGLIIATLSVYLQIRYIRHATLGFDKRNIVNLLHTANLAKNAQAFKKELLQQPGIISASYCNRLPPNIDWQYLFRTKGSDKDYVLAVYEMDYDHLKTMRYTMIKGRFFSADFPGDSVNIILNETAASRMKLSRLNEERILTDYGSNKLEREVIGIMQDFNFQSLKDSIQPMAIVLGRQPNWEMAIRIDGKNEAQALEHIRSLWDKHAPDAPFEYTFLDKNFDAKLRAERRMGFLFLLFTVLAIVIACLGLFGLATFTAELRIKEIGIRKVMGATVGSIVALLNRDFLKLVWIANLLAWPITWWLMNRWLAQFAYHIAIPWWIFAVAGAITTLIAFLSVSFQAARAAKGNPVNSLRNE